jgi:hypothetical protein
VSSIDGPCPSRTTTPAARRRCGLAALFAAAAMGLLVAGAADGGDRRPPHHPPPGDPPGGPIDPDAHPDGGHGDGNGHDELPPTSPGGGGNGGGGGGGWVAKRLEALAIVDQFPPAVVVEFEGLLMGWLEFNGGNDSRLPFDEWLWANGVEDPEEFGTFMLIFQIIFALR